MLKRALLAVILACGVAACAGERSQRFTGEFERLEPDDLPPAVQDLHREVGRVPGLHALEVEGESYLVLCAGRRSEGGSVEVLEMARPTGPDKEVRILTVLRPGPDVYPCAFLRTDAPEGIRFKARLSAGSESIEEWRATPAGD